MYGYRPSVEAIRIQYDIANELRSRLFDIAADQIDFLLVILPTKEKGGELYTCIKKLADQDLGLKTVCVAEETLLRNARQLNQLVANLALKINLKLGGVNQIVGSEQIERLQSTKTMVVGLDVTHPSPGSSKDDPSIAGIVASVDGLLAQWPAEVRVQARSRDEMITALAGMMASRLILWERTNGCLPENVLIYRDGVSEGQYQTVIKKELPDIRKACANLYSLPEQEQSLPRLTIAIVGKRHHTRFYPTRTQDSQGRFGNCIPGTVVDRGVTQARNWDFFLQSHAAIQGTARPAHYHIILDEIFTGSKSKKQPDPRWASGSENNQQNVFEELTLAMTHVFGRATRIISTPAPVRYADMVFERARC